MSTEDNKALVRRGYEAISSGNLDALLQLLSPDYVDHNAPLGFDPGPAGTHALLSMYRAAFPDLAVRVEDMLAEGDTVVARVISSGTQHGEVQGIPATGKHVVMPGIEIFRIANGKVAERWGQFDQLGMLHQLGVIPEPG
jgi:steroid delta-isomerase-like uncharacterized protein